MKIVCLYLFDTLKRCGKFILQGKPLQNKCYYTIEVNVLKVQWGSICSLLVSLSLLLPSFFLSLPPFLQLSRGSFCQPTSTVSRTAEHGGELKLHQTRWEAFTSSSLLNLSQECGIVLHPKRFSLNVMLKWVQKMILKLMWKYGQKRERERESRIAFS